MKKVLIDTDSVRLNSSDNTEHIDNRSCHECSLANELKLWKNKCTEILESIHTIYAEVGLDLTFNYLNPYSLKILNYTQDDIDRGLHLTTIFPNWELDRLQQVVTKIFCNDFGNMLEWQLVTRNGEIVVIEAIGSPIYSNNEIIGFKVVGNDITNLRHVQKQFKDSEKRFANSFVHSPIGMAIYFENGHILKTNNIFKRYFPESVGMRHENHFIHHYFTLDDKSLLKLDKGIFVEFETHHTLADEETKYYEWYISRITEEPDSVKTYFAQVIDISHKKMLEFKNHRAVASVSHIATSLRKQIVKNISPNDIIANNSIIAKLINKIPRIAASDASVLIMGESGTGKEVIARLIHDSGKRKSAPFVSINCGSIPENLIESELFGHNTGAFTGATSNKKGKFLLAQSGTLFLDEVGDMPFSMQVKLLRVLENKKFYPLGSETETTVDVRIIAATHQPLELLVKHKQFRQDLFYRLNVVKIELPPLRERIDDILPLSHKFIKNANERFGKNVSELSTEVKDLLIKYSFPGNIRELENIIDQMVIFSTDAIITRKDLPEELLSCEPTSQKDFLITGNTPYAATLSMKEESEKSRINKALIQTNGNRTLAAEILGIHRTTLIRKLNRWKYPNDTSF